MRMLRLVTDRLELKPLPAQAAAALPENREAACRVLGSRLSAEWPDPHLLGVLRRHAGASVDTECFGVWVMIERCSESVVGDIGFRGPDDAGTIEVGYSVIPRRRRRGYATEAASALVGWARSQPSVHVIVAGCDPSNVPSVCTLERVGFRRAGEANGEIRWRFGGQLDTRPARRSKAHGISVCQPRCGSSQRAAGHDERLSRRHESVRLDPGLHGQLLE